MGSLHHRRGGPSPACPAPSRGTLSGAPQISGPGAVSSAGPWSFSENLGIQVDSSSPYMNIMVMEKFSEKQNRSSNKMMIPV